MIRVMLKHGQVPQGQQPTLTVPRLPWVGGNPKMPRKAPGWVSFHHPVGLGWRARSGWQDFYFTVLKLWTFWDWSSPELSCEMTRLSVCLGLPVEGLVSLTPLTPCRASLSLSSLEEGGHSQANAAWSLPSVQDTSKIKEPERIDCCLPVHSARGES